MVVIIYLMVEGLNEQVTRKPISEADKLAVHLERICRLCIRDPLIRVAPHKPTALDWAITAYLKFDKNLDPTSLSERSGEYRTAIFQMIEVFRPEALSTKTDQNSCNSSS